MNRCPVLVLTACVLMTACGLSALGDEPVVVGPGEVLTVNAARQFDQVTLGGGTIDITAGFSTAVNADAGGTVSLDGLNDAVGVVFGGAMTVTEDSVITGRTAVVFGTADAATTIDVADGKTLTIACNSRGDVHKTGKGTLRFLYPLSGPGSMNLADGTVSLARDARFAGEVEFVQADGASLILEDGAALKLGESAAYDVLSSAEVWMDASRLEGTSVASVPNLGRAGGSFQLFEGETVPGAPGLSAINGKSALSFDGNQALGLWSYTNTTKKLTFFMVWQQTAYSPWGGPFSLYPATEKSADNTISDTVHLETYQNAQQLNVKFNSTLVVTNFNQRTSAPFRPACLKMTADGSTFGLADYLGDDVGEVSANMSATRAFNISLLCLGGRMGNGSATVPQWYGMNSGNNRMYKGLVGEVLVFSRTLSAREIGMVEAYLHAKWFGSEVAGASGASVAPTKVTVTAQGQAVLSGNVLPVAGGSTPAVSVGGSGSLSLSASTWNDAEIAVGTSSLALRQGAALASRAQIWVDAADAATLSFDDNNCVTNLVNKGCCGGAFAVAPGPSSYTDAVKGPIVTTAGFGGVQSLYFDKKAALRLSSYTNRTATLADRSIHVYAVVQRNGATDYSFAYSFANSEDTATNDHTQKGSLRLMDNGASNWTIGFGSGSSSALAPSAAMKDANAKLLCVAHLDRVGGSFGFEGASETEGTARSFAYGTAGGGFAVDSVLLGGRFTECGAAAYKDSGSAGANRLWRGYVGEFIVFDDPLSPAEDAELLAYLRKKWMDKGSGSSVPPGFLNGDYGEPNLSDGKLSIADGATVEYSLQTLAVKTLEVGSGVNWVREWTDSAQLFAGVRSMSFAGSQTIDFRPALPESKSLVFGGTLTGECPTWTVRENGTSDMYGLLESVAGGLRYRQRRGSVLIFR